MAVAILLPLLVLLALTVLFRLTDADIAICRFFYDAENGVWAAAEAKPWKIVYFYGPIPGLVLGVGGLAVGVAGLAFRRLRTYRETGFLLAAMLALGPGLIVNGIFKPYWCRPRPKEVTEFGGDAQFVQVWDWDSSSCSKSFPSGHASMGFYLMAPAFLLHRLRRAALEFMVVGLACGSIIGLARVVQGAHFPSDVLWSGGMVYLSGLIVNSLRMYSNAIGRRIGLNSDRQLWQEAHGNRLFQSADFYLNEIE